MELILELILLLLISCLSLGGCALIPGAIVGGVAGAVVTPFIQPQVDRGLVAIHLDKIDPGGAAAVK